MLPFLLQFSFSFCYIVFREGWERELVLNTVTRICGKHRWLCPWILQTCRGTTTIGPQYSKVLHRIIERCGSSRIIKLQPLCRRQGHQPPYLIPGFLMKKIIHSSQRGLIHLSISFKQLAGILSPHAFGSSIGCVLLPSDWTPRKPQHSSRLQLTAQLLLGYPLWCSWLVSPPDTSNQPTSPSYMSTIQSYYPLYIYYVCIYSIISILCFSCFQNQAVKWLTLLHTLSLFPLQFIFMESPRQCYECVSICWAVPQHYGESQINENSAIKQHR